MKLEDFKEGVWFVSKDGENPCRTSHVYEEIIRADCLNESGYEPEEGIIGGTEDRDFYLEDIDHIIMDSVKRILLEAEFKGIVPEYEICVLCGENTSTLKGMPVEKRDEENFLGGAGEVCQRCKASLHPGEDFEKEVW